MAMHTIFVISSLTKWQIRTKFKARNYPCLLSITLSFGWFELLLYISVFNSTLFLCTILFGCLAWHHHQHQISLLVHPRFYRFCANKFIGLFVCFITFSAKTTQILRFELLATLHFALLLFWPEKSNEARYHRIFFAAAAATAIAIAELKRDVFVFGKYSIIEFRFHRNRISNWITVAHTRTDTEMHFRFAFEFLRFYFGDKTAKATATAAVHLWKRRCCSIQR